MNWRFQAAAKAERAGLTLLILLVDATDDRHSVLGDPTPD
jgi:hypothetical protein